MNQPDVSQPEVSRPDVSQSDMSQLNELENKTGNGMDTGRAQRVLAWAGFRILDIGGERCSCVWATRDCAELREALRVAGFCDLPVRFFEGSFVPDEHKLWPVAEEDSELTPDVLDAMERTEASSGEPWVVRDERMAGIRWYGCWAEWKAAALNRLFDQQCAAPGRRPANVTAATVGQGERKPREHAPKSREPSGGLPQGHGHIPHQKEAPMNAMSVQEFQEYRRSCRGSLNPISYF
jgi:hypothetical protein